MNHPVLNECEVQWGDSFESPLSMLAFEGLKFAISAGRRRVVLAHTLPNPSHPSPNGRPHQKLFCLNLKTYMPRCCALILAFCRVQFASPQNLKNRHLMPQNGTLKAFENHATPELVQANAPLSPSLENTPSLHMGNRLRSRHSTFSSYALCKFAPRH